MRRFRSYCHSLTFAKVVDSFVDCRLWQVKAQICCSVLFSSGVVFGLTEVCEMLEASHPHMVVEWVEVWPLVLWDEVGAIHLQPFLRLTGRVCWSSVLLKYGTNPDGSNRLQS